MKKEYYVDDRQLKLLGACERGRKRALKALATNGRIPVTEEVVQKALALKSRSYFAKYGAEMLISALAPLHDVDGYEWSDKQYDSLSKLKTPKAIAARTRTLGAQLRKALKTGALAEDHYGSIGNPKNSWFVPKGSLLW